MPSFKYRCKVLQQQQQQQSIQQDEFFRDKNVYFIKTVSKYTLMNRHTNQQLIINIINTSIIIINITQRRPNNSIYVSTTKLLKAIKINSRVSNYRWIYVLQHPLGYKVTAARQGHQLKQFRIWGVGRIAGIT